MKNLVLYIACIIYTTYIAIMHNNNSVVILLFVELFVPLPLFILCIFQYRKLEVSCHFPISVTEKGKETLLEIEITNPLPFPIPRLRMILSYENSLVKEKHKMKIKTSVGRKQTRLLPLQFTSNACGAAKISLTKVRVYDYLGLLFINKKIFVNKDLIILPTILVSPFQVSERTREFPLESDLFDSTRGGNDPSEVFQIRDYRDGDRPQNIHWKLTAKSNAFMVKEYSRPIGCTVILFLNTQVFSDVFITIFSSISSRLTELGCCHYISWYQNTEEDLERFMIEAPEHLYELISRLYQEPPSDLKGSSAFENNFLFLYKDKYKNETFSTWLMLEDSLLLSKNGEPVTTFHKDKYENQLLGLSFKV